MLHKLFTSISTDYNNPLQQSHGKKNVIYMVIISLKKSTATMDWL